MSDTGVLKTIDDWPVPAAAAAVVGTSGVLATHGDVGHRFALASVTKPLVARAAQVAVEEGAVELDTPAGPPGSTVRHLLAHTSGLAMLDDKVLARPGTRRIYSNVGFRVLAETIEAATGIEFAGYLTEAVLEPLGMSATTLARRRADRGVRGHLDGHRPGAVRRRSAAARRPSRRRCTPMPRACSSPDWPGCCPATASQRPNDWGLGFELRDGKSPHWTGSANSPATFGHFGQSGTFIWADPVAGLALVVLTNRDFGDWAHPLWPALSDEVLREFGAD